MSSRPTLSIRTPRPSTKLFDGTWVIYRRVGNGFSRTAGGGRMPRFRHASFDAAQAEAERLAEMYPESLFIILQERASVRMKSADCADPSPRIGTPGEAHPSPSPGLSSVPSIGQEAF